MVPWGVYNPNFLSTKCRWIYRPNCIFVASRRPKPYIFGVQRTSVLNSHVQASEGIRIPLLSSCRTYRLIEYPKQRQRCCNFKKKSNSKCKHSIRKRKTYDSCNETTTSLYKINPIPWQDLYRVRSKFLKLLDIIKTKECLRMCNNPVTDCSFSNHYEKVWCGHPR